jgi:hypothetical protein
LELTGAEGRNGGKWEFNPIISCEENPATYQKGKSLTTKLHVLLLITVLVLLSCTGGISDATTDPLPVIIESVPTGAYVIVDSDTLGKTNGAFFLKAGENICLGYNVYDTCFTFVQSEMNGLLLTINLSVNVNFQPGIHIAGVYPDESSYEDVKTLFGEAENEYSDENYTILEYFQKGIMISVNSSQLVSWVCALDSTNYSRIEDSVVYYGTFKGDYSGYTFGDSALNVIAVMQLHGQPTNTSNVGYDSTMDGYLMSINYYLDNPLGQLFYFVAHDTLYYNNCVISAITLIR